MDRDKLIGELAQKHGILLDKVDPVFAVVALNEVVFEEMISKIQQLTRGVEEDFKPVLEEMQATLGAMAQATKTLRNDSAALVVSVKKAADDAASEAGNKAIDKIAQITVSESNRLKTVSDSLSQEIGTKAAVEVQRLVRVPVERAVDDVKAVAVGLDTAKGELDKAAATVRMAMWQRVAWTCGAALLGAVLALGAAKAFGWLGDNAGGKLDEIMLNQQNLQTQIEAICRPAGKK